MVNENDVRSEKVVLIMMNKAVMSAEEKYAWAEKMSVKSQMVVKAIIPDG